MRMGTGKAAEHGLGAGLSIGREPRVIPLQMFEVFCIVQKENGLPHQSADWFAMTYVVLSAVQDTNQGGTASIFVVLGFFPRAIFHF